MMNIVPDFLSSLFPAASPMTPEELRKQQMREAQLAQAMRAFQGVQALGAARMPQQQALRPMTLPRRATQAPMSGILG